MSLELKFNEKYETLDLIGRLPRGTKSKVSRLMTYNPTLKCYQSPISLEVVKLSLQLNAQISQEIIQAFELPENTVKNIPKKDRIPQKYSQSKKSDSNHPLGFIVKHSNFGLGRLIDLSDRVAIVCFFFPPNKYQLKPHAICRELIPVGTFCESVDGICIIKEQKIGREKAPNFYNVEFQNGLVAELPETELTPIKLVKPSNPLDVLGTLQQDGYPIFKKRESFAQEYNTLVRRCIGVKSLLSSRIDLHPHQAYVAGTVILDSQQRYLLADEVGLGKTIEAGIVIHDFLARNSQAKILILCPGTIVQQWFSEMYSKFSGVIFRVPEISGINDVSSGKANQVILSFHTALTFPESLINQNWDLVVVDEVHHLLRVKSLYELVKKLSKQDNGLLLLSALPAQHRDQEYYELLMLLEPKKYHQNDKSALEQFSQLFERQREIGGRIGVVNRRLAEFNAGDLNLDRLIKQLITLMKIPVLRDDKFLISAIDNLNSDNELFSENVRSIINYISDYYRINRRILRNRRQKLIENEQMEGVEREKNTEFYDPDQYEINARVAVQRLLRAMRKTNMNDIILLPLTRQLFQAVIHPTTLLHTLQIGKQAKKINSYGDEYSELSDYVSYKDWNTQMLYFWGKAWEFIDHNLFQEVIDSAEAWQRQGENENFRLQELITFLQQKHHLHNNDKLIIFAGFPELATILSKQLQERFGKNAVARFYFGLHRDPTQERNLKEKEVRKFRIDQQTWILVCDETGGEGRNFQFAKELINYDLPWQAAKIEQRIGRLDRMGRKNKVVSNQIIARGTTEEVWFKCLSEGFGIFNQSISGLEFALREVESEVTRHLLSEDDQVLWEMPTKIKNLLAEERALDESQNQMDEVSYERVRAEEFRRAQSNKKQDRDLEISFLQYFKMVSDRDSISFPWQNDYPEGVITFHPEDVHRVELKSLDHKNKRTGTFRREIAQNRPDLEFFSIGNDFFDSLCKSLSEEPAGRTYAIECTVDQPIWRGFEFSYRINPSKHISAKVMGYQNLLDYLFAERVEHCFVDEKGKVKEPPNEFLRLRRSFDNKNKIRIWKNITKQKSVLLSNFYPNWNELLRSSEEIARTHIHERYIAILSPKIERQINNIDEKIRKLKTAEPTGWNDQIQALEKLKDALVKWELELDIVGFLSINGGILGI